MLWHISSLRNTRRLLWCALLSFGTLTSVGTVDCGYTAAVDGLPATSQEGATQSRADTGAVPPNCHNGSHLQNTQVCTDQEAHLAELQCRCGNARNVAPVNVPANYHPHAVLAPVLLSLQRGSQAVLILKMKSVPCSSYKSEAATS